MLILENLNKERLFSPLVNSTIPISIEESISLEIPNKPNNGANMLEVRVKIWLFSNMEHTTEKRTTKPPTTRMELILLDTLFDKISPKFEKETFKEELSKVKSLYKFFSKFFFHHLKQKPTIRQEIICDIRRITPIFIEWKRLIPTVPKINKGPELLVNAINLSLSILFIIPWLFKLETVLAPIG